MTIKTNAHHGWRATAIGCITATVLLFAAGTLLRATSARAQMPQRTLRSVNGTITDSGHEPIRGAVVELRNGATNGVVTYITDANGRYNFKRLDGGADYEVWVLFRGNRSTTRSISKFDNNMVKVIDFTVRTY
jgi:protocatechuate 3,4-dioxygenase beta subunit